ncbi:MAG: DUF2269 family protein [Actinomycetota bacterium]|nr:DUF2269 family protein [Actinomycetota bacterium]
MYHWILFFHVLSAIVWLGGSIYVEALMAAAGRGTDEGALVTVFRRVGTTNMRLFNLAGISAIAFGLWLVFISPGWEFEMIWIGVGILLATITVIIDLFYATPRTDRVERMMDDPEQSDAAISGVIKQVVNAGHVRVGLLFVAFVFMIFKF